MNRVRLEVLPWATSAFGLQGSGRYFLELEVAPGTRLKELFARLALEHKAFGEMIFDARTQQLSGHIDVIYNDRLLGLLEGLEREMEDGDTITLLPAFAGGSPRRWRKAWAVAGGEKRKGVPDSEWLRGLCRQVFAGGSESRQDKRGEV